MHPVALKIGDHVYRLTPPTARQSQEYLDFAKAHMPCPIGEVVEASEQLPAGPVRDAFLERHLDKAFERKKLRGTVSDPDLEAFGQTETGLKRYAAMLFKRHHPNLTEDEVLALVEAGVAENGLKPFEDLKAQAQRIPMEESAVEAAYFPGRRAP